MALGSMGEVPLGFAFTGLLSACAELSSEVPRMTLMIEGTRRVSLLAPVFTPTTTDNDLPA